MELLSGRCFSSITYSAPIPRPLALQLRRYLDLGSKLTAATTGGAKKDSESGAGITGIAPQNHGSGSNSPRKFPEHETQIPKDSLTRYVNISIGIRTELKP